MLGARGGLLARYLRPSKRALTIPISVATGAFAHVLPGDRVDIILTRSVTGPPEQLVSETILRNILVLSLGGTINRKKPVKTKAKGIQKYLPKVVKAPSSSSRRAARGFITFEVTPEQAEAITLAMNLGKVGFTLNPTAKPLIPKLSIRPYTTASDISRLAPAKVISISRGAKEQTVFIQE